MYLVRTKRQILKIMSAGLSFVFIFSHIFPQPAFASRSDAGGGELAEFDPGKWALGTAVGVASFSLGSAVSSGINSAWNAPSGFGASAFSTGFTDSISSWTNLSNWVDKYSVFAATTQVSNALGKMGNYYGWDRDATLFISSVGSSIAGGGLNPGQFGSGALNALNGMALGAINGTVEGAILMAAANKKGKLPFWAGPVAGLAGNFATGAIVGGLTQNPIPHSSYSLFSFTNSFNFSEAFQTAGRGVFHSLLPTTISLGVNYLTEDMGKQDAYIYRQAFSGLYPVANATSSLIMSRGKAGEARDPFSAPASSR